MRKFLYGIIFILLALIFYITGYLRGFEDGYFNSMVDVEFFDKNPMESINKYNKENL